MMPGRAVARVIVPLALGALEVLHPGWSGTSVADGVAAAGGWWIPLHVALVAGYALLAWTLWPTAPVARVLISVFTLSNTAYLAVDGLVVGVLATTNPAAADGLWNSSAVAALAALVGATWCAAVLSLAATRAPRSTLLIAALILAWMTFIAGTVGSAATVASRLIALAIGASLVYAIGARAVGVGLLVFAAVMRQHVGPEAALGMLFIALAGALDLVRGRSTLAAWSPPGSD